MKTNMFKNLKSPQIIGVTDIDSILDHIKNGLTKQNTLTARQYGKGSTEYETLKAATLTFSPNACFYGKRSSKNLKSLTGFIYLDFDNNINPNILQATPFVYAYWKSFSGNGYGALALINNLTVNNYSNVWIYLEKHFQAVGLTIDPQTKDITRQNIISYDPDILINSSCFPIDANGVISVSINSSSKGKNIFSPPSFSSGLHNIYNSNSTQFGLGRLKYKTTLDDYSGKTFIVIPEGKDSRNSYLPSVIEVGKRNYWLQHFTDSLLFNNPTISDKRLEREVLKANSNHCNPPLSVIEVIQIVDFKFKAHTNGDLKIITKKQKIWPLPTLPTKQKRIIIGQQNGILRRQETLKKLIDTYLGLKSSNERVTQKMVGEQAEVSIRTVKRYWNEITIGVIC
jgi:hypothetical protein